MSLKISQLTELTTVQDADVLPVVNNGATKKVTKQNFLKETSQHADFVDGETPAGAINGANTVFTTAHNYLAGSIHLYLNGLRLKPGSGNDYAETSVNQITLTSPPQAGDSLLIDYRK